MVNTADEGTDCAVDHVLIVEDERQFLEEALDRAKVEPFLAASAPEALPSTLRSLATDVLHAAHADDRTRAEYVYRLTIFARAVSASTSRGLNLTETCARAVRVSRSELQRFTMLTTRWRPAEIRALMNRRDSFGHRVTVQHLLSVVGAPPNLRGVLEGIVREGADLRRIRTFLQEAGASSSS